MEALLTVALVLLGLALLSMRPLDAVDARTATELRAAMRHAGWPRILLVTPAIVLVAILLVLTTACWMGWHAMQATGGVLTAIADGIDQLICWRTSLEAS